MARKKSKKNESPEKLDSKYLFVVFAVAFVINLIVWFLAGFGQNAYIQIDSYEYLNLGGKIFENGTFPSFARTPVYPMFVGFFESFLGFSISQFVLIQIILSLINIWLVWRLSAWFISAQYQMLVALVFALDPVTVQVTNYVLSETVFSFFLLAGLNLMVYMKFNITKWWLAIPCGLSLGFFALCRPVGQYLPFILILWFYISTQSQGRKYALLGSVIVLFAFLSIPEAWKYRNHNLTGHKFISTTISINMYNYRAAWNVAKRDGRTFDDVKDEFQKNREAYARENDQLSNYDIAEHFTKEGLEIILATPWETVQQGVRGLVYLYGGIYNGSLKRIFTDKLSLKVAQIYSFIYWGLVYIGFLFLMWHFRKLSNSQKQLFVFYSIVIGYFTFFSVGVESYARLRMPFVPYLVTLSLLGWKYYLSQRKNSA